MNNAGKFNQSVIIFILLKCYSVMLLKMLFNELYNLKVVSFLYDFYFTVELLNATEN